MRKFRNKFLTACLALGVLAAAMGITACGGGEETSSPQDSSSTTHKHSWTVDSVINEATCTQGGKAKYVCECGESKTATLPPLGHDMPETGTVLEPTNCDKEGLEEFECTVCHEKMTVPIPMPDHIYGEAEVTVEPGCFTFGEKTFTCVNCPDFYTEQVDPTGHIDENFDGTCDGCQEFIGVKKIAFGENVEPMTGPWYQPSEGFVWYSYDVEKNAGEEPHVFTITDEKERTEGQKSLKIDFANASNVLSGKDVGVYILHIGMDHLEFGANYTLTFYAWATEDFNGNINKMLNNNNFGNEASCVDVNYESVYGPEQLAGQGWVKVTVTFRANWSRIYDCRSSFRLAFDMPQKWNGALYLADFEVASTNYLLVQAGQEPVITKQTVEKDGRYTIEEGSVVVSGCGIQAEAGTENGKAIGGTAAGRTATMTYTVKATEKTKGELYIRLSTGMDNRPEDLKLNQNYEIKVNGEPIEVAATPLNGTLGWANYFEYYAGEIAFVKGDNTIEIKYLGTCPHNLDNLKLVLGETVNEKVYDVYAADGEYIVEDAKAALTGCARNAEAGTLDGFAIGGMSLGKEATMTFRFTAEEAKSAALYLRAATGMGDRPEDLKLAQNYQITVNGTVITVEDTAMADALGWTNYYEYLVANVSLVAGDNVIEIKFLGTCPYNLDCLKVVVGTANA